MPVNKHIEYVLLAFIAVLLWFATSKIFTLPNGNSEEIATSIGLMLIHRFWLRLGLPALENMVLEFRTLELWEQLKFSVALFALLFLGAIGVMIAIL